jgi:hypothetical protein
MPIFTRGERKAAPVRVKKTRQNLNLKHFAVSVKRRIALSTQHATAAIGDPDGNPLNQRSQ